MTAALALLLDSYRELNSRKLFWLTLLLSVVIDCLLLLIGITPDKHLSLLWLHTPFPVMPSTTLSVLLKQTYIIIGINLWLTWAATILALISTASIFPDFISGGSIDLVLAKPIGRLRLFLLKYLTGLLFVGMQVGAFSVVAFVIIGLRSGAWEPGLLLAVPLVLVFFSYLFAVCVLLGLLTRSTIASLLLTILFWLFLFLMNTADKAMLMPHVTNDLYVEKLEARLATAQQQSDSGSAQRTAGLEKELAEARSDRDAIRRWHGYILAVKTPLPKTDDTMNLLVHRVIAAAHLSEEQPEDDQHQLPFLTFKMRAAGVRVTEVLERFESVQRSRTLPWVLGTSLIFEGVVLALAAWIFCRRDF